MQEVAYEKRDDAMAAVMNKYLGIFILFVSIFIGRVAFAELHYSYQQEAFLKEKLPILLARFSQSVGRNLNLDPESIQLTEPRTFSFHRYISLSQAVVGHQHCTRAFFTVTDGENLLRGDVYLVIQEGRRSSLASTVDFEKIFDGNIRIQMTGGCWGTNQINNPALNFVQIEPVEKK
jgi:hypothetical protein